MDRPDLAAGRFQNVEWVDTTASTNADLIELCSSEGLGESPADGCRVLITDEQTAGRGRLDRTWEMPSGGGLLISFYTPWSDARTAHLVPTALGVAITNAIGHWELPVSLKWPNDLVVSPQGPPTLQGKKLGGMLSSSVTSNGHFTGVVAGLGCNVSWPPSGDEQLPDATSLHGLGGSEIRVEALARALISSFDDELTLASQYGAERVLDRYRQRCVTIGQNVRVESADTTTVGRATDVDESGALLVEVGHIQRRISVGDVVHLRPEQ